MLGLALILFGLVAGTALAVTGKLTQLAGTDDCVSDNGSDGDRADDKALIFPKSVAVSSEKKPKSVYVVAEDSDVIAVFARSGS